jgi:hypothetical protein
MNHFQGSKQTAGNSKIFQKKKKNVFHKKYFTPKQTDKRKEMD